MLAITHPRTSTPPKTTPNLLPCSIKHNGPVNAEPRYWSPTTSQEEKDGTSTAYFRGRKLRGRKIKLPPGYQGVVLEKTEKVLPHGGKDAMGRVDEGEDDEEMEVEVEVEVKMLDPQAKFDEIVVWGHEAVPEDDDVYVKGVQEWISFAEAMHDYEKPTTQQRSLMTT